MNKCLLYITLSLSLFFSALLPTGQAQADSALYEDLDQASDWALDSIAYLDELGITQGYDDGTYQPRRPITRQEVAVLLVRALGLKHSPEPAVTPPDVDPDGWSYPSIRSVLDQGLMGAPGEPFRPADLVTREELLWIFVQATGARGQGKGVLPEGDESRVDPSRKSSIETSVELGLLQGDGITLELNKPTERQEIAVILTRLMKALQAPVRIELELTIVSESRVRIGAFEYPITDELRSLIRPANLALLNGSAMKVKLSPNFRVEEIVDLTIPASKRNMTLDGSGIRLTGNLNIQGDNLTIRNLSVDGTVTAGGSANGTLRFEQAAIGRFELLTPHQVTLSGDTTVQSFSVHSAAVEGSSVVLQQNSEIADIVVPDKKLVASLVQDYSGRKDQIKLINGQPLEVVPLPGTGGGGFTGGSPGDDGDDEPSAPYVAPVTVLQQAGEAYVLPVTSTVRLPDGTAVEKPVSWRAPDGVTISNGTVSPLPPAVYRFIGTVDDYDIVAVLNLDVRLPLRLELGSESGSPLTVAAGAIKTFTFTAEPVTEVVDAVHDVSYILEWRDENGTAVAAGVELMNPSNFHRLVTADYWILANVSSQTVDSKELISLNVKFAQPGTYSLKVSAIKYTSFP